VDGIPFTDPSRPVKVPLSEAAFALSRSLLYRCAPLKWTLAFGMATCRLDLARRPARRRLLQRLLESVAPGASGESETSRQLVLARALRKIGAYTYAPVYRRSQQWLMDNFRPEGLEHLEAVKDSGGGAIVLGTHAGQSSWIGPILRQLGYPMRRTQRQRISVDTYLLMKRDGTLADVLPYPSPGESGLHLKRLYDMLRQGVWMQHVGDFPDPDNGISGTYMGRRVRCVAGPWVLARIARVPVIPALLLTDENLDSRLLVCRPITVDPGASIREGLEQPLQTYLDFASRHLGAAPWNMGLKHWQKLFPEACPQDELTYD
jgi:lauroyl/myristoyl acyltransferase